MCNWIFMLRFTWSYSQIRVNVKDVLWSEGAFLALRHLHPWRWHRSVGAHWWASKQNECGRATVCEYAKCHDLPETNCGICYMANMFMGKCIERMALKQLSPVLRVKTTASNIAKCHIFALMLDYTSLCWSNRVTRARWRRERCVLT